MKTIVALLGGLFAFLLIIAIAVGVSAAVAYLVMFLWNYIAVNTNHSNAQITFWVAWAGCFLLSIISGYFRTTVKTKEA